jgi:hypothetical protein
MGPGINPSISSSQSALFSGSTATSNRISMPAASLSSKNERGVSSGDSVASDRSGEVASVEGTPSPPRSGVGMNNYTGAVMTQNKLRPLRLVQENKEMGSGDQGGARIAEEEEAARKKANRGSWISWFNRSDTFNVSSPS